MLQHRNSEVVERGFDLEDNCRLELIELYWPHSPRLRVFYERLAGG
jgi:hypothetical protein